MTELGLAGAAAYTLAGLVCARLIAGHLAWRWNQRGSEKCRECWQKYRPANPDDWHWFWAWVFALCIAPLWPLIGLLLCFRPERWAVGEERRQVQRSQRERIAELEKELRVR